MAPSYLGEYFANECSSEPSNVFVTHTSTYYFVPSVTLFIAVMVVSAHMWLRRFAKSVSLYFEGTALKNEKFSKWVVERVIVYASKQQLHLQAALLVTANQTGSKIGMPPIVSFGEIARALSNRDNDSESTSTRVTANEGSAHSIGMDIELGQGCDQRYVMK